MVRAWPIEESNLDENKLELVEGESERKCIDLAQLKKQTGVAYWQVSNTLFAHFPCLLNTLVMK